MSELDMDFMDDDFAYLAQALGKQLGDYDSESAQEECLNKLLRDAVEHITKLEKVVEAVNYYMFTDFIATEYPVANEGKAEQALYDALEFLKD